MSLEFRLELVLLIQGRMLGLLKHQQFPIYDEKQLLSIPRSQRQDHHMQGVPGNTH